MIQPVIYHIKDHLFIIYYFLALSSLLFVQAHSYITKPFCTPYLYHNWIENNGIDDFTLFHHNILNTQTWMRKTLKTYRFTWVWPQHMKCFLLYKQLPPKSHISCITYHVIWTIALPQNCKSTHPLWQKFHFSYLMNCISLTWVFGQMTIFDCKKFFELVLFENIYLILSEYGSFIRVNAKRIDWNFLSPVSCLSIQPYRSYTIIFTLRHPFCRAFSRHSYFSS